MNSSFLKILWMPMSYIDATYLESLLKPDFFFLIEMSVNTRWKQIL